MFDLINRYRAVFDILSLDTVENQQILDVGGSNTSILPFLANKQKITVCDIAFDKKSDELNKVLASGFCLPFKNNSFDHVICIDTLEHILPDKRKTFIQEMLRVAQKKLVIATPHSEAYFFENMILSIGKLLGKEMKWLGEHKQMGLPKKEEVKEALNGCHYEIKKNCNTTIWFLQILADFFTKPLQLMLGERKMLKLYGPFSRFINFGKTYRIIVSVDKT